VLLIRCGYHCGFENRLQQEEQQVGNACFEKEAKKVYMLKVSTEMPFLMK
jgi:hypothetical protein